MGKAGIMLIGSEYSFYTGCPTQLKKIAFRIART